MRYTKVKDFFSNAWVISIISGILVFFITNAIIIFQDKRHQKKEIFDANTMLLNHLRGYVVDNGLPQKEIINAVRSSIAREYNVKYEDLLNTKLVCEELVKDIIGNIYISNDNKISYINMLQEHLIQNDESEDNSKILITSNINKKVNYYISILVSLVSALATVLGTFLSLYTANDVITSKFSLYQDVISIFVGLLIIISLLLQLFRKAKKHKRKYH